MNKILKANDNFDYVGYAIMVVRSDIGYAELPPCYTLLEAIDYYRRNYQETTIKGLSLLLEDNPGIGCLVVGRL